MVNTSVASDVAPWRGREYPIPVSILHYYPAALLGARPANVGRAFFIEEPLDRAGFITDAIFSTGHIPYSLAGSAWGAVIGPRPRPVLLPSASYPDELLDWEASIADVPKRPSGMLTVTLQYVGRGTPTPVEDPWD